MEELIIRAQAHAWQSGVDILMRQGRAIAENIIFTETVEGQIIKPTLTIDYTAAQTLMDDLWNAGLRPTEGTGSAGSLLATENHLNDMRKIAFKKLNIDVKK